MAEKRTMLIEVQLDLKPAENQLRGFVAANNSMTIPVASPVGAAVPAGGIGGAASALGLSATTTEQAQLAAAMAQAQANAAPYAMGPGGAIASPNWSYIMAQQQAAGVGAPLQRSVTAGFFAAPRARAVLGSAIFGLHEIGRTGSALRNADEMAGFARTPEEANLLLAEAVEQGSGGFFGSLAFGLPNAFGIEGSPAQVAQQARMSAAMRKTQDEIRSQLFDISDSRSVRSAFAAGGMSAAQAARAANVYARQIDESNQTINGLTQRLDERTPERLITSGDFAGDASYTVGGDLKLTGTERANVQLELNKERQRLGNLQEEAKQDAKIHADQIARQTGIANLIATGASERDVRRYEISSQRFERGGPLTDADLRAQEFKFRQEDELNLATLSARTNADNLRTQGQFFQAGLVESQGSTTAAIMAATKAGAPPDVIAAIRSAGTASINAAVAGRTRQLATGFQQVATSNAVIQAQLANDPLGAQLASIQGRRDESLMGVTDNGFAGFLQRAAITGNAALQGQLATRNFNRARSDVNLRLSGAIERTMLDIEGGPSRFIRQQISGIVQQTEEDTRGFFRGGMPEEALRRRELGGLQLRQAESDFYRSIQYREASPRGVYGTGTLGDIGDAFAKAQAAVSGAGSSESSKPATSQDIKDLGILFQRLFTNGIAAVAG